MSRYIINGGVPLFGEVSIRGAKNAAYKQIIASLLSSATTHLSNIPQISDVKITESIAKSLGAHITHIGRHSLEICTPQITSSVVPHGTGEKSRTSFIFAAPLLARTGKATIPIPGGDKLGTRPLDRLFDCFSQMNIHTHQKGDLLFFETDKILPTTYKFPKPSHTVTEVVLMTAIFASGTTTLTNAAQEPEIDDLIDMLNSMGANIKRLPTEPGTIIIQGVPVLDGAKHQVISDRNEAVTFACAALATKGSINILRINPEIIQIFLKTITSMGARVEAGKDELTVSWHQPLKAVHIETTPEPGFMTDWQPVFSVVLSQAVGSSSIVERVWPSRFQHLKDLASMDCRYQLFNPQVENPESYYFFNQESDSQDYFHGAKIYGPANLKPAKFTINDLRSGASLTLAALSAPGTSIIDKVEYIERGYENLAHRLKALGAAIEYIKT
ncbi:MAG: UDP-N-acetylglucosamine 1-carboxyvinyltransferase [Candidatus Shapirobacteria bacterium]|jgi:UDP-N-acetylglucosamine 1-carboxyvinyltransferase